MREVRRADDLWLRWAGCEVVQPNPFMREQHEKICDERLVVHKRCKQQIKAKDLEEHKESCCDDDAEVEEEIDADC